MDAQRKDAQSPTHAWLPPGQGKLDGLLDAIGLPTSSDKAFEKLSIAAEPLSLEINKERKVGNILITKAKIGEDEGYRISAKVTHPGIPVDTVQFTVTPAHLQAHYYYGDKTPRFLDTSNAVQIFEEQVIPALGKV